MNIELIVGEIDAELKKLRRIRAILEELLALKSRRIAKPLIVLPPKPRREYTRRMKQVVIEPRALAAPMSNRPVFVPKAAVREIQPAKAAGDGRGLEAVMRRKLLGGAA